MEQITETLYLGAYVDTETAQEAGIQTCVNLAERAYDHVLRVVHRPIPDEAVLPPIIWEGLLAQLRVALACGPPVLVHCRLGVSRAPALVAFYLAKARRFPSPDAALAHLRTVRPCVNPHPATWDGVLTTWKTSRGAP